MLREFTNFFKSMYRMVLSRDNQNTNKAKPKNLRNLTIIGKNVQDQYKVIKIDNFTTWLRKFNKVLFKKEEKFLEELHSMSFLDAAKAISEKDSEELSQSLYEWFLTNEAFIFDNQKGESYLIDIDPFVLKFIYRIDSKQITKISDVSPENFSSLGDIEEFRSIRVVGYGCEEIDKRIIEGLNQIVNPKYINWKFYVPKEDLREIKNSFGTLPNVNFKTLEDITSREIPEKEQRRRLRYKYFYSFATNAEKTFNALCRQKDSTKNLRDIYGLNVIFGGRNGGEDSSQLDVFWGNRIYSIGNTRKTRFQVESGCTILFQRLATGYVRVYLLKGVVEGINSKSQGIRLYKAIDPRKLIDKSFVEKIWSNFLAYTACYSLDGDPTIRQRCWCWRKSHFKREILDTGEDRSSFLRLCKSIGTWVITIGFSGALLSVIQEIKSCQNDQSSISTQERILRTDSANIEHIVRNTDIIKKCHSTKGTVEITYKKQNVESKAKTFKNY